MLSIINGEKLLGALWELLIWAVIIGVLWWAMKKLAALAPEGPWLTVGTVILVVLTVVVLINILLGLTGKQFIHW